MESCRLLEPDMILRKKSILIIYNRQPNWYGAIVCHSENNTKILQKRRKELWMGHFDEVKNNPTNSANISKMLMAKFETFFLFYYISQERSPYFVNFFKVSIGKSRKFQSTHCLTFLIVCSIVKEIQNVFLRKIDTEIKLLTLYRTYFLCWVVKTTGVADHRRDAKRS